MNPCSIQYWRDLDAWPMLILESVAAILGADVALTILSRELLHGLIKREVVGCSDITNTSLGMAVKYPLSLLPSSTLLVVIRKPPKLLAQ